MKTNVYVALGVGNRLKRRKHEVEIGCSGNAFQIVAKTFHMRLRESGVDIKVTGFDSEQFVVDSQNYIASTA